LIFRAAECAASARPLTPGLDQYERAARGKSALTELQQQIEAIRREAFQAGYAAAIEAVRELASKSAPEGDGGAATSGEVQEEVAEFLQPRKRHRVPDRSDAGQNAATTLA
jgi:hypothetical protein